MPSDPRADVKINDGPRPRPTVAPPGGGLFGCLFALALIAAFVLSITFSLWLTAWFYVNWPG